MAAAIGLLELDLRLPESSSLKEKRKIIKSIKDRVRYKHNISVAEVGFQDQHERCHLAFVTIASERSIAQKRLDSIRELVYSYTGVQVVDHTVNWL